MIPQQGTALLKFSATWCGPCKMLAGVISQVQLDVPVVEIDVDQQEDLTNQYRIRGVPTLVLVKDGVEVKRAVGAMSATQLQDFVK